MELSTFYKIYYLHRIKKAKALLKFYLLLIIPFRYLINIPFFQKKINLDNFKKNNMDLFDKDLDYLFDNFNSDKGNLYENQYAQPIKKTKNKIKAHGYSFFYEKYFLKIRNNNLKILEIGSFYGNATASLFFYFKNAILYSGDIFPDLFRYKSKRINSFFVDSSDEVSIKKNIVNLNVDFDIIIEDASHMLKDQIISLFILFQNLKAGGLFIVEELEFPDTRKDMNLDNEKPTLKEILFQIKSNKGFFSKYITFEQKKYFLENFKSIDIYKGNFNEIAVIEKK